MVADQPTNQTAKAALRRSYVIEKLKNWKLAWQSRYWISNGSLFDWSGMAINNFVLRLIGGKYYIYIYGDKLRFIAIPVGAQAPQGNVNPKSAW